MKCLVVVAHPVSQSLCHYLCHQAVKHLEAKGYDVEVLDLYQQDFQPSLSQQERESYYATFEVQHVEQQIEQLKKAQSVVLVFPTWWFGFPAILKGWFDRVWAPGHAYDQASGLGALKPRLENLKKLNVITTLGAPWWVDTLIMWQPVKRILKIALLGACTKRCKFKMLSLYKSETITPAKVEAFVAKIKAEF